MLQSEPGSHGHQLLKPAGQRPWQRHEEYVTKCLRLWGPYGSAALHPPSLLCHTCMQVGTLVTKVSAVSLS